MLLSSGQVKLGPIGVGTDDGVVTVVAADVGVDPAAVPGRDGVRVPLAMTTTVDINVPSVRVEEMVTVVRSKAY